ncbi:MAG: C39 family peptidase [Nanoarchaeota archaeon]|nr:C39 family peptidase [Nanoarchaeota archaeon]
MMLLDFPELRQTFEWDCGAKALQATLTYYGIEVREELVIKYAKTNSKEGTSISDMLKVLKKYELDFEERSMSVENLKTYLDKKIPIIILLQAWNGKSTEYSNDFHDGHWVVAIGYDKDRIIFEDPYSFQRTFLKKEELEKRWHGKEEEKKILNYGIAVMGKKSSYSSDKIIHMD